jgi:hypothetical protein
MTIRRLSLAACALAGALTSGCNGGSAPRFSTAALVPLSSCDDALDFVREVALQRMNQRIDEELAAFARGERCWYGYGDELAAAGAQASPPSANSPTTGGSGGGSRATTSSGTNNQVAGVDEADFVKNDGKYIYVAQNGALRIIDAYPGTTAHEVAKFPLDGNPKKLFVEGDRALVYVSVPNVRTAKTPSGGRPSWGAGRECTYGYDCELTGDGTSTKLVLLDLTDRAAPRKVREVLLSGSLIAARRAGDTTHTVVSDNLQLFPELTYSPSENLCDPPSTSPIWWYQPSPQGAVSQAALQRARAAYEALREKNRQIILSKDLSNALPTIDGQPTCGGLYRAQLLDGASFTSVVSLDISGAGPVVSASVVSSPGVVYASEGALYMAVPSEQARAGGWYSGWDATRQLSTIHKFTTGATPSATAYVASGVVRGRVLNQFALDERDGALRVATTTGRVPDPDTESQVTILRQEGATLSQIGFLGHIAPTEDIRSVRFDGPRAFVVTFKKTDPLFVLDVADPTTPRVLGELKIPGFSTYMHMLDEDHLLSIGYDADDHGSFAYFDGVLLQIFDVHDPHNPTLLHRHVIGTRGSSSEALTNHLAFTWYQPLGILAVPMTVCEGGDDGRYGTLLSFSGLMLFDVDIANGIRERGRVAHAPASSTTAGGAPVTCSTWWTNANSDVKRSVFLDRFVYSISGSVMNVQSVDALGTTLQSLPL